LSDAQLPQLRHSFLTNLWLLLLAELSSLRAKARAFLRVARAGSRVPLDRPVRRAPPAPAASAQPAPLEPRASKVLRVALA
jgi:hypothetical protein